MRIVGHRQQRQELGLHPFGLRHAADVAIHAGQAFAHFQPLVSGGRTFRRRLPAEGLQCGSSLIGSSLLHQRVCEFPRRAE